MTAAASHTRTGDARSGHARQGGFTYVGLVILVAIIALVGATTVRLGVTMQRAQAERDLLHIGEQFADALKSYAAATPAGQPQQPPTLKELLKDPRFPGTRRHLRKIFIDPMTGKAEWGVIYMGDNKGVLGIHSLSQAKPIKVANFPSRFQAFDGKQKVSDWVFTFNGQEPPPPGQLPGKGGAQPGTGQPGGTMTGGANTGSGTQAPDGGKPPATPMTGATVKPPEPPPGQPSRTEAEPAEPAEPAESAEPPPAPEPAPPDTAE